MRAAREDLAVARDGDFGARYRLADRSDAERRWSEIESGTVESVNLAEVNREIDSIGMREEDWPDTPQNREKILALMDAVEPLELSAEDEARITAVRAEMKAKSIEAMRQLMGLQP